ELWVGREEVAGVEWVWGYGAFANGGNAISPYVVERVRIAGDKILFVRSKDEFGRIIEPRHVAMMNAMMRETLRIGTAQKAQLPGWQAAGKTGTSQDFRDAWFIGYTAHLVTGVWVGNDDSSPTRGVPGGGRPTEIGSRVMNLAHQGVPVAALPGPGVSAGGPLAAIFPQTGTPPPAAPILPAGVPQTATPVTPTAI